MPEKGKRGGVIVLAIGLPGSGKSTWFARRNIQPLSTDLIRKLLLDDESDQSQQGHVFATLYSLLRRRLVIGRRFNYIDATNLHPQERRGFFRLAGAFGYKVDAIYFDVPLEVCLTRNSARHRQVPVEVMQEFAHKLRPPTRQEGFRRIIVVNTEGKSRVFRRDKSC